MLKSKETPPAQKTPTPEQARADLQPRAQAVRSFYSPVLSNDTSLHASTDRTVSPVRAPVVQRVKKKPEKRYPTFFSYVHGNIKNDGEISEEPQGPHTVAHKFIQTYSETHSWEDMFDEQVQPYSPDEIENILALEGVPEFENRERFTQDYTRLYLQLLVWRNDGTLHDIDSGDISAESPLYQTVQQSLMCILEMHPYGSYGWNRGNAKAIMPQEIAGKGESIISMDDYEDNLDTIVDAHGYFANQDAYLRFLEVRVPPNTSATLSEEEQADQTATKLDFNPILNSRIDLVKGEADEILENVRHWLRELHPQYGRFVRQLAGHLPLEEAQELLYKVRNANNQVYTLVDNAVSTLLLIRRFHGDAVSMENWRTLADMAGNSLADFSNTPYPQPSPENSEQTSSERMPANIQALARYYADYLWPSAPAQAAAQQPEDLEPAEILIPPPALEQRVPGADAEQKPPESTRALAQAMELARCFLAGQSEAVPQPVPAHIIYPSDETGVTAARNDLGLQNAVTVFGPGGEILLHLDGSEPVIHLIHIGNSFAVARPAILQSEWLTKSALSEDAAQDNSPDAQQESSAPASPDSPPPTAAPSPVLLANNCLITAIFQAHRLSLQASSAEEGAAAPTLDAKDILAIRKNIHAPFRSFLDADKPTINAIRRVLSIDNPIVFWYGETVVDFLGGNAQLPPLDISFKNAHFTVKPHAPAQEAQPAEPVLPAVHAQMEESLIRATAIAGQRFAGTGIITPNARQIRDIRHKRGCVDQALPCDAHTIDVIRQELGIDNPICILDGLNVKNFYPGMSKRSPILLRNLGAYFMAVDPGMLPEELFDAICSQNPDFDPPDHLVKSILFLAQIENPEAVYLVHRLCQKKPWEFLAINRHTAHIIQAVLNRPLNIAVNRGGALTFTFSGDFGLPVFMLIDTGDRYQPDKAYEYAAVFGEAPAASAPESTQNAPENFEEADTQKTDTSEEPCPEDTPLLAAIAEAFTNIIGARVPRQLAQEIYTLCHVPPQALLLPTIETVQSIQNVLSIPNTIIVRLEPDAPVICPGLKDLAPLVLRKNETGYQPVLERPERKIEHLTPETIDFAGRFLGMPGNLNPQAYPDLPELLSNLEESYLRLVFLMKFPDAACTDPEIELMLRLGLAVLEDGMPKRLCPPEGLERLHIWMNFNARLSVLLQFVNQTPSNSWLNGFSVPLESLPAIAQSGVCIQRYRIGAGENGIDLIACSEEMVLAESEDGRMIPIMEIIGENEMRHYCYLGGKSGTQNSSASMISALFNADLDRFRAAHAPTPPEEALGIVLPPPSAQAAAFARLWDNFIRAADPCAHLPYELEAVILNPQTALEHGVHLLLSSVPSGPYRMIRLGELGVVRAELIPIESVAPTEGDLSPFRTLDIASRISILTGNLCNGALCATQDFKNYYFLRAGSGSSGNWIDSATDSTVNHE